MGRKTPRPGDHRPLGALLILSILLTAWPVQAKDISKGAQPSENRVVIRTDGLACYFCAYGLERFFKKTGRIAAFDLEMKKGLVEAVFIRGQPLVPVESLVGFVHDAGFTPRWVDADLVGRLEVAEDGGATLILRETGELIPLDDAEVLRAYLEGGKGGEAVVRVRGRAHEDKSSAMRLAAESIEKAVSP